MSDAELLDLRLLLERHVVPDTVANMVRQAVTDRRGLLREVRELKLENARLRLQVELASAAVWERE